MSDTEDSISLAQALRNFGDAAHQLAAAWERQDRRSNIREPSMEDSTTAMDIQDMDSALQQHCAATADPSAPMQPNNTAPEACTPQQHEREDVRPCIFKEGRGTIKCRYCSAGRAECIILPLNITEPLLKRKAEWEAIPTDHPERFAVNERFREVYAEAWKAVRRTPSLQRTGRWMGRE
ncbi:hypothetical protein MYU51_012163 [Penicillium brevicompactum]